MIESDDDKYRPLHDRGMIKVDARSTKPGVNQDDTDAPRANPYRWALTLLVGGC